MKLVICTKFQVNRMNCVESRRGGGPIDPPFSRLRVTIFSRRLLGLTYLIFILSYLILSHFIFILSYLILSYLILSYLFFSFLFSSYLHLILSYLILSSSYLILSFLFLSSSYLILSYRILSRLVYLFICLHNFCELIVYKITKFTKICSSTSREFTCLQMMK